MMSFFLLGYLISCLCFCFFLTVTIGDKVEFEGEDVPAPYLAFIIVLGSAFWPFFLALMILNRMKKGEEEAEDRLEE